MNVVRSGFRLIAMVPIAFTLASCGEPKIVSYQGYVEGEYVLVASPYAGSLQSLSVARGQTVENDAALFTLEQGNESAAKREADEKLRSAQAKLENLRKGQRAPELEALLAEAAQAESARRLSEAQYKRNKELFDGGFISSAGLDEARANLTRDRARVEQAQAQIRVARQSVGRTGELAAAQADIDAAKAVVAQAEWKLAQKAQRAPQAGCRTPSLRRASGCPPENRS
jgi:HlyD family secretion protein